MTKRTQEAILTSVCFGGPQPRPRDPSTDTGRPNPPRTPVSPQFLALSHMSVEISKLKSRVSGLSHSLDELESILEPLFSQTLPETVVSLEPLQQAKLQTDVPYVIYDLVFSKFDDHPNYEADVRSVVYLKLKGIDPKTHSVVPELVRACHVQTCSSVSTGLIISS